MKGSPEEVTESGVESICVTWKHFCLNKILLNRWVAHSNFFLLHSQWLCWVAKVSKDAVCQGRVANPRPVATVKTGHVRMCLWVVAQRDQSWLWRPVLDLQHAPDIHFRKFRYGKTGPKFTKIVLDLVRTSACHHAKFHRARPNDVREKCCKKILPTYEFWHTRGPLGPKFASLGTNAQQVLIYQYAKFRRVYLCMWYLLANFWSHWQVGLTHKQKTSLYIPCGDSK